MGLQVRSSSDMSKICLAFLGLLALLVLVHATEDEEEVSLTEGNTISREIRDAGISRPKKGKYKRPGERKGRRVKKGKSKRPGERKGRDPNTIICPSCPPSECPPGQSPAPAPSPSPSPPQPTP